MHEIVLLGRFVALENIVIAQNEKDCKYDECSGVNIKRFSEADKLREYARNHWTECLPRAYACVDVSRNHIIELLSLEVGVLDLD